MKNDFIKRINSLNLEKLLKLSKDELEVLFGKDFSEMKNFNQNNPHHHLPLLEHTLQVVEAIRREGLSEEETLELKIAALYHDVGKPKVAFEKNGKTVFYNHGKASKEIVEKELMASGVNEHTIDKICFFVEYHDMFISFKLSDELKTYNSPFIKEITAQNVKKEVERVINERTRKDLFVPTYRDFGVLMRLCRADASAQSEIVIENGIERDSRERKFRRLNEISRIIEKLQL